MRDVDISPNGAYVVVTTTGAAAGSTGPCDTAARFEVGSSGLVGPTWTALTGGDTYYGVEVGDGVVYVGGHFSYLNNPFGKDTIGPGAVDRQGLAALDPANGLPLPWNPTRDLGVGVFDFLRTPEGLWVGSDTTRIGPDDSLRSRIALLPSGGLPVPAVVPRQLPGHVYMTGSTGQVSAPSVLYRVNAGGGIIGATTGIAWGTDSRGAPSPHHVRGPRPRVRGPVSIRQPSVPVDSPPGLFVDTLLGTPKKPSQSWNFRVQAGVPLVVRLYFAQPCKCTGVGKWRFKVRIENNIRAKKINVAKSLGFTAGMARTFSVTPKDPNLDLDLLATFGRASVAAIEVSRATVLPPITTPLVRRSASRTAAFGALQGSSLSTGRQWADLRGAFMLGGLLYAGWSDGGFTVQSFNGSSFGPAQLVSGQDRLVALTDWQDDIRNATSMFYDNGRIYFTRLGSTSLFYRYFTPGVLSAADGVVGAVRQVAATSASLGVNFAAVRVAFLAGGRLYFANAVGTMFRATWARGTAAGAPVKGSAARFSGTGVDFNVWQARVLFLAP
jgi:hypothetical protein